MVVDRGLCLYFGVARVMIICLVRICIISDIIVLIYRIVSVEKYPKAYLLRSEEKSATIKDEKEEASKRRVYLHLQYNPDDPSSRVIQSLWRRHVSSPSGELPLNEMTNNAGKEIEVDQLTIAYHRAPNLGNLLSYRKITKRTGSKVSSYC